MKHRGLGIPNPRLLVERTYNTYKPSSEVLVGSIIGGTNLNYVAHKGCIFRASADGQKQREFLETEELMRRKDLVDGAGLNCLRRATDNMAWIMAIPHCLNGTELSREEFQDNLLLQICHYALEPPH